MADTTCQALAPQTFFFNSSQVRVVHLEDGPWWIAQDVCDALGINLSQTRRLDEDEKGLRSTQTPGGPQEMLTVNESGLYTLALGSRKPEAKAFKRWLTHEVLPAIRRTGSYSMPGLRKIEADSLTREDVIEIFGRCFSQAMPLIAKTVALEVQTVTAPLLEHFAASVRPKSPTGATQQRLGRFIASSLDCRCFSCLQTPVVTKDGMRLRSTEWSRWKGVHRRSISEVWLICADCGLLYRTDPDARIQGDEKFRSFQARRLEWEHLDGMKVLQMEIDYSGAYDED